MELQPITLNFRLSAAPGLDQGGPDRGVAALLPTPDAHERRGREILNAIRYLVPSGCAWRMLPIHFPPWPTVSWWVGRLAWRLMFRTIHDMALIIDHARAGRDPEPGAAVIDNQTIKAPAAHGSRDYDGAKKTVGRERRIAMDTDGRLPMST